MSLNRHTLKMKYKLIGWWKHCETLASISLRSNGSVFTASVFTMTSLKRATWMLRIL